MCGILCNDAHVSGILLDPLTFMAAQVFLQYRMLPCGCPICACAKCVPRKPAKLGSSIPYAIPYTRANALRHTHVQGGHQSLLHPHIRAVNLCVYRGLHTRTDSGGGGTTLFPRSVWTSCVPPTCAKASIFQWIEDLVTAPPHQYHCPLPTKSAECHSSLPG